jgi:hypothetical protein
MAELPQDGTTDPVKLAERLAEVVRVEGPIHTSEATRRLVDASGVKRLGPKLQSAVDLARDRLARAGMVRQEGDFLWPAELREAPLRDRAELPPGARRLDVVAPEEIARAVDRAARDSFGIDAETLPIQACRILGFPRVSEEARTQVSAIISAMLRDGRLAARGEDLVAIDPE